MRSIIIVKVHSATKNLALAQTSLPGLQIHEWSSAQSSCCQYPVQGAVQKSKQDSHLCCLYQHQLTARLQQAPVMRERPVRALGGVNGLESQDDVIDGLITMPRRVLLNIQGRVVNVRVAG